MPRINRPVGYKVIIIESERGWGQKIEDELYFDNETEARAYVEEYNQKSMPPLAPGEGVPDWYMRAEYRGSV